MLEELKQELASAATKPSASIPPKKNFQASSKMMRLFVINRKAFKKKKMLVIKRKE
ncbi:hypothetical protein EUTSA_v10015224mg [Eutrema salsugineum]|uniref:Uncharacterized protein n=1 Tax=Eutrema salsugineum TaxID=72664 RepID=V4LA41_EUTSA|nr:hypothetical protein EUTSA_v10015224mg [Eutrema salsugineum]